MSARERCTCGETACESELCDCDARSCPVDHAAEERRSVSEIQNPARYAAFTALFLRAQEPISMTEASRLLDAYAHELAEKVMALRSTVPDLKARQVFKNGYDAALMVAASTVSEEVLNGE